MNEIRMCCPVCRSAQITPHLRQPIVMGGMNSVSNYSCAKCGVMFMPVQTSEPIEEKPIESKPKEFPSVGAFVLAGIAYAVKPSTMSKIYRMAMQESE